MFQNIRHIQVLTAIFIVVLMGACSNVDSKPDADALALRVMAENALEVSGIEEPVLRQIFVNQVATNPFSGSHGFAITNKDATIGVQISAETPNQIPDEWRVTSLEFPSRYQGEGFYVDIESLNVGPSAAMAAITKQWPGCVPSGQTVAWSDSGIGNSWYVFCDISGGTVSGVVNADTGEFTPSDALPAVAPGIATAIAS